MKTTSSLALVGLCFSLAAAEPAEQITCKVVDAKARAIAGAEVAAYGLIWDYSGGELRPKPLGGTSKTDRAGSFSFDVDTQSRDVIVVARKRGLALGWGRWTRHADGPMLTIRLGPPKLLAGAVVDEAGRPIPRAQVRALLSTDASSLALQEPEEWLTTTTDPEGRFRFGNIPAEATADFLVEAPGRASLYTFQVRGRLVAKQFAAGRTDIRIVLPPAATIEGRVVDAAGGKGIPGVRLLARPDRRTGNYWSLHRTVSGRDGGFRFQNVLADTYHLRVICPLRGNAEWVLKPVKVVPEAGRTLSGVTLKVTRGGFADVVVRDAGTERPISEAWVQVTQRSTEFWNQLRTGAEGSVRVRAPLGECHFSAGKDGYLFRRVSHPAAVTASEIARVEILLEPAPSVSGTVRDRAGKPVSGAEVRVRPGGERSARTDAAGKFRAGGPTYGSPSRLFLFARHVGRNLAAAVEIRDGSRPLEVALKPAFTLSGRVTDPDGAAIPVARVGLWATIGNWVTDVGAGVVTDAQGRYELRGVPPAQEGADYRIDVEAAGYGPRGKAVLPADASTRRLELDPIVLPPANLSISGVVVDSDGSPVVGETVIVSGQGQPRRQTVTDEAGRFTIGRICRGPIRLQGALGGGSKQPGFVRAEGGDTNVKIVLGQQLTHDRQTSLAGKVLPSLAGLNLRLDVGKVRGKPLLVCFWDMNQRPSRHCMRQLAAQAAALAAKGVVVVSVHASDAEPESLEAWVRKHGISLPVGRTPAGAEAMAEALRAWGVRGLPWLILTDREHVVRAEGFALTELKERLQKILAPQPAGREAEQPDAGRSSGNKPG